MLTILQDLHGLHRWATSGTRDVDTSSSEVRASGLLVFLDVFSPPNSGRRGARLLWSALDSRTVACGRGPREHQRRRDSHSGAGGIASMLRSWRLSRLLYAMTPPARGACNRPRSRCAVGVGVGVGCRGWVRPHSLRLLCTWRAPGAWLGCCVLSFTFSLRRLPPDSRASSAAC
jgi:hypothetical protein